MTKKTQPKSGSEIFVPLNMLKKSPRNVRKVEHTATEIEGLAASISANGMLQNLVVEPERDGDGHETGHYLVTIGEGRRLAQLLRAKRRHIKKTDLIRCVLDTEHDAHQISLAENVIRSAMHPADEFEAFALLHNDKGMAAEDIAARFGVTPAVVRQRLKLGAVSRVLMAQYREGGITLEQMMAFTVTDDHARQQEVWQGLGWTRMLTPSAARSPKARYRPATAARSSSGPRPMPRPVALSPVTCSIMRTAATSLTRRCLTGWCWPSWRARHRRACGRLGVGDGHARVRLPRHQHHASGLPHRAGSACQEPAQAGETGLGVRRA